MRRNEIINTLASEKPQTKSLSRGFRLQARNGVFLEDLCPKFRDWRWRQSLQALTENSCFACGATSESNNHVSPRSLGRLSITENCVLPCLASKGHKGDREAFGWYSNQLFDDSRHAMALKA